MYGSDSIWPQAWSFRSLIIGGPEWAQFYFGVPGEFLIQT